MQLLTIRHIALILSAIMAGSFVYFFTRHSGIGISPDSVSYYTTAFHIQQEFSLTDFNHLPLVDFPAGYPFFLALVSLPFKANSLQFAPFVNGCLFISALAVTGYIIRNFQNKSVVYEYLFLFALACSPALLEVYSMLWSETLFILLSLLFFVAFTKYLNSHTLRSLMGAAVIAAFAFVTRYAGITLLLTGVFLLLFDGRLVIKKKLLHLVIFELVAISLTAVNIIHNLVVSKSVAGVREKALRPIAENIMQLSNIIAEWLPFLKGHETVTCLIFVFAFTIVAGKIIFNIIQQQFYTTYENTVAVFFIIYSCFIITVASISRFEDLSNRLLSPLYIPLLLVGSHWTVATIRNSVGIKKKLLGIGFLFFYASLQFHHYQLNAAAWEGISDAGIPGYTEDSWKYSPTVAYIKQHQKELPSTLFSDAHDAVYFLTGLHALPLPHKEIEKEKSSLLKQAVFGVIWFTDGYNPDLIDIDYLKKHKLVLREHQLVDGTIYIFSDSLSHTFQ